MGNETVTASAVILDRFGTIAFSATPVPDSLREEIASRFGGRISEAVSLTVPDDLYEWPPGSGRPEVVLCSSKTEPDQYRVFKYARQVEGDSQPTGLGYAEVGSWTAFVKSLGELDDIAHRTVPGEPPGLMDEALRGIDAHRPPGYRLFEGMS